MMVPPVASAPLVLVVASTVQFADVAHRRSEGANVTETTEAWGWA